MLDYTIQKSKKESFYFRADMIQTSFEYVLSPYSS